jgi:hypothetical protein
MTVSITDLFPMLGVSPGPMSLGSNFNMTSFLDSAAGIDYQEIYSGGSIVQDLKMSANYAQQLPSMLKSTASAMTNEAIWKAPMNILGGNAAG